MKKVFDEMDRMGIKYTLNTNPTEEEIKRIKKQIEKKQIFIKNQQQLFKDEGRR